MKRRKGGKKERGKRGVRGKRIRNCSGVPSFLYLSSPTPRRNHDEKGKMAKKKKALASEKEGRRKKKKQRRVSIRVKVQDVWANAAILLPCPKFGSSLTSYPQ